jgi:outer membrane lipase/esterase
MSLQYIKLGIDGYTESGAGALNLDVDSQHTESLQGNIGGKVSYSWQAEKARVLPYIRASYGYESCRTAKALPPACPRGVPPLTSRPPRRTGTFFLSVRG